MSSPKFHFTFNVPGTSFKGSLRTRVRMSGNVKKMADELLLEFVSILSRSDWNKHQKEWGEYYLRLLEDMGTFRNEK